VEAFEHERVVMAGGRRSGLPIIVAVHSTALGPAIGGCRTWRYPGWPEAVADALRLSAAMTLKCAVAGLPCGGGKSVIALPSATMLTADRRRAVFLDLGKRRDKPAWRRRWNSSTSKGQRPTAAPSHGWTTREGVAKR